MHILAFIMTVPSCTSMSYPANSYHNLSSLKHDIKQIYSREGSAYLVMYIINCVCGF